MEKETLSLRNLRKQLGLTQKETADFLGVSLRSYLSYEKDMRKRGSLKYRYMVDKLSERAFIDEEHGILTLEKIRETTTEIFADHDVSYCYLFGSYAKGKANEESDVDLLISTTVTGLDFFGLIEELREALHKKVDLLTSKQLIDNLDLLNEILRDGIKMYG